MSNPLEIDELITAAKKICHDINQPLTVIMARSELMMLKTAADDPNYKALEQIHAQTDNMAELVDKLRLLFKDYQGE